MGRMPGIEERKKYVHVRVNPPSKKYKRYRTVDVGKPGGMKIVVGVKDKNYKPELWQSEAYEKRVRELESEGLTTSDAQAAADAEFGSGKGPRGGTTEVQKFELERKDVGVRNGKLYPKTARGRREIRSLGGSRAPKRRSLGSRLLRGY